jgi:hypothetical protein
VKLAFFCGKQCKYRPPLISGVADIADNQNAAFIDVSANSNSYLKRLYPVYVGLRWNCLMKKLEVENLVKGPPADQQTPDATVPGSSPASLEGY